jgi:hypothetical protein
MVNQVGSMEAALACRQPQDSGYTQQPQSRAHRRRQHRHGFAANEHTWIGELDPLSALLKSAGASGQHVPDPLTVGAVRERDGVAVVEAEGNYRSAVTTARRTSAMYHDRHWGEPPPPEAPNDAVGYPSVEPGQPI